MPFQTKDAYILGQELRFLQELNRENRDIFGIRLRYLCFLLLNLRPSLVKLAGQASGRRICAAPFPSQHRDDGLELHVHVCLRRSIVTKLAPASQWCCSKAGGSSAIGPPSRR